MADQECNIFNCDILICGTSLLNTLLSVYFSIKNYKVINIDKNSYYGDVNCSLNFNQFENEKRNLNNFYEEYIPFSNLNEKKKKLLEEIIVDYFQINNNKFNIDVNPKIIYNESNIVNLLINLNAHIYVSFVGIQNFFLTYKKDNQIEANIVSVEKQVNINCKETTLNKAETKNKSEEKIETSKSSTTISKPIGSIYDKNNENKDDLIEVKIPLNKSQVFLDNNLNLNEKRMIMNFIYKNITYDKNYTFSNFSNYSFLKKANITQNVLKNNGNFSNEKKELNTSKIDKKKKKIEAEEIKNVNDRNENSNDNNENENISILEYLRTYNITEKIIDYIIYGIGLFDLQLGYNKNNSISEYYLSGYTKKKNYVMNKKEFLQRLHILINSLNKFKLQNLFENAFIYPCYGLNDVIYALSRVSCLNNSIYMINRKIQKIICDDSYISRNREKKSNTLQIKEVLLDNGYKIRAKFFITSGSNINFNVMKRHIFKSKNKKYSLKKEVQIKTSRLLVLSTYSLIGKTGLSFYIHKQPKSKEKEKIDYDSDFCVHILQLDYNSGSCPLGLFLTYFTYLEIQNEEKNTFYDTNICRNQKSENKKDNINTQKPLSFLLLLDVLKLFTKKYKNSNDSVNTPLPLKSDYNEKLMEKLKKFLNSKELKKKHKYNLYETDHIENKENGTENEKSDTNNENESAKNKDNIINENYNINNENNDKKNENNNVKKKKIINSFNNLLRNEGIIYFAYYEYKPIVYRKDTIKLIEENLENYKNIFENIEHEKEKRNEDKEIDKRENERDELIEMNFNEINKKNQDKNEVDEFNKRDNGHNNNDYKNEIIGLKENKNICNLLFTCDIHNYPIYPMVEDVSMFFYIINKIYKKKQNETIYDTFNNMKSFFNFQST